MTLAHFVYVAASIVFAGFIIGMFIYNTRLRSRRMTVALKGRQPLSREEGILLATEEREHPHPVNPDDIPD